MINDMLNFQEIGAIARILIAKINLHL